MTEPTIERVQLPKGGRYSADSNPDGTWNVRDVPVFVPFRAPYDLEWMETAVGLARARYEEQHVAPLHTHHHNFAGSSEYEADENEDAGLFLPTRVGEVVYEGSNTPAIFADFLAVPEEIYQRIKSRELKYRSVEVLDNRIPEINSCALLSHECPKFRLPMLTIGSENGVQLAASAPINPEHAGIFVFSADEEEFVDPKPEKFDASGAPASTDQKPGASAPTEGDAFMKAIKKMVKKVVKKQIAKGNAKPEKPEGSEAALATSGATTPTGVFQATPPPKQDKALPIEQRGNLAARASAIDPKFMEKFKEVARDAEKAKERVKKLESDLECDKAVRVAIFRLEKTGQKVDEAYTASLREKASKSLELLEEHVVTREKFGAAAPPPWRGLAGGTAPTGERPKTLETFSAKGPEKKAAAEAAWEEYQSLPEVMREQITADDFIRFSVEPLAGVQRNGK